MKFYFSVLFAASMLFATGEASAAKNWGHFGCNSGCDLTASSYGIGSAADPADVLPIIKGSEPQIAMLSVKDTITICDSTVCVDYPLTWSGTVKTDKHLFNSTRRIWAARYLLPHHACELGERLRVEIHTQKMRSKTLERQRYQWGAEAAP